MCLLELNNDLVPICLFGWLPLLSYGANPQSPPPWVFFFRWNSFDALPWRDSLPVVGQTSGSLASCAGGKQGMIFFPRGHSPGGMTSCENYELLRCTPGTRRCPPSSPSPCLWTQVLGGLSLRRKRRSCQITFAGGMSEVVKEVRG